MTEKIFIVDDEVNLLNILKIQLSKAGYDVTTFTNPVDILNQAKTIHPDLFIVDYMMPMMDGLELTRRIKAEPGTANIPVIILSAINQTNDKLKAFEAGAEDYITKPYETKELLARIRSALVRSTSVKKKAPEPTKLTEGLKGKIGTISLFNLIQLLEMDAKTGILHVQCKNQEGEISFSSGKIVAAKMGHYLNKEAVYRILLFQEGEFEFENKEKVEEHQITTSNQNLLLDAARRRDELERYKEIFPSLDAKVTLRVSDIREKYAGLRELMKPEYLAIIDALKDNMTISEIIEASKQDDLMVLEELKNLFMSNLIEVS